MGNIKSKDDSINNKNIRYINGINRIIKLKGKWNNLDRTIVLVGEHHGIKDCDIKLRKNSISYVNLYKEIFNQNGEKKKEKQKFIDFFIEVPKSINKLTDFDIIDLSIDKELNYIDLLRSEFSDCSNVEKKYCNYKKLRVHWDDTRLSSVKSDNKIKKIIEFNDEIKDNEKKIKKIQNKIQNKISKLSHDEVIEGVYKMNELTEDNKILKEEIKQYDNDIKKEQNIYSQKEALLDKLPFMSKKDYKEYINNNTIFNPIKGDIINFIKLMQSPRTNTTYNKYFDILWNSIVETNSIISNKILSNDSKTRGYDRELYTKIKQYYKNRFSADYDKYRNKIFDDIVQNKELFFDKFRYPLLFTVNTSDNIPGDLFIIAAYQLSLLFWVSIMDTYTLMRMFKWFIPEWGEDGKIINPDHPNYATNIIVHAGDAHIEIYRDFLTKSLKFKEFPLSLHTYKSRRKDIWVPHTSNNCVVIDSRYINSDGTINIFDDPVSGGFLLPIPSKLTNTLCFIGMVIAILFVLILLISCISNSKTFNYSPILSMLIFPYTYLQQNIR